ncbi:MAG: hypothetical protein AB1646_06065 [Thermodesulfobacteriota bacterium]
MHRWKNTFLVGVACVLLAACAVTRIFRDPLHRDLDESLTIVTLIKDPKKYLNKEIVISVRYGEKGTLPCPLEGEYVNIIIKDRVSYIAFDKVWMKETKADELEKFKANDTVVMRVKVFRIDKEKEPNLEVLEIAPE